MHLNKWIWKHDDDEYLKIFCKSWKFGARSNVEPFLSLAGFLESFCKFWRTELAAMLSPSPVLRRFEEIVFDLAAMFEFKLSLRIFYELAVM